MREKEPRDLDQMDLNELKGMEQELLQRIAQLDAGGDKGKEWNDLNLQHEAIAEAIQKKSGSQEKMAA